MKRLNVLVLLLLAGCSNDPRRLDGQIVQDRKGNFYKIYSAAGDNYHIREHEPVDPDNFVQKEKQ